jgi:hypothetical protein
MWVELMRNGWVGLFCVASFLCLGGVSFSRDPFWQEGVSTSPEGTTPSSRAVSDRPRLLSSCSLTLSVAARLGGTPSHWSFTLSNNGKSPLILDDVRLEQHGETVFLLDRLRTKVIAPSDHLEISGTFTPDRVSVLRGYAVISYPPGTFSTQMICLVGSGYEAGVAVSPRLLDFGPRRVGYPSPPSTEFAVSALNLNETRILRLFIRGTDASMFSLVRPPALPCLLPGKAGTTDGGTSEDEGGDGDGGVDGDTRCRFAMSYFPERIGETNAELVILTDSEDASALTVPLHGEGVSSLIRVSPAVLELGVVNVGTGVKGQYFVTNTSGSPVRLSRPEIASDRGKEFSMELPKDPVVLAPGESVPVVVSFSGSTARAIKASVVFPLEEPVSPSAFSAAVTVDVVAPGITAAPASVDFGAVDVGDVACSDSVELVNRQSASVVVDDSGAVASDPAFSIDHESLRTPLEVGERRRVKICFSPLHRGDAVVDVVIPIVHEPDPVVVHLSGSGRKLTASGGGQGCSAGGGGALGLALLLGVLMFRRVCW